MTPPFVTRFAPSPSGPLHLGHAWSAIRAHDEARAAGGAALLRIDDIDAARSRPEHVAGIVRDLDWLGLRFDGNPVFQSRRLDQYRAALDRLRDMGLAYPCFCTRKDIAAEIAASGAAPHGDAGFAYPGICRSIARAEALERAASEPHCWRLDVGRAAARTGPLDWSDADGGIHRADPARFGDIVLARKDAPSSYHLASTLDDAALGVTHVVRGRDLESATDVQRLLQALLGLAEPVYLHHALVAGPDGKRLAKRDRAASLRSLREGGQDGRALAEALRQSRFPVGYSLLDA